MPPRSPMTEYKWTDVLSSFCRWTSVRGLQHLVRSEYPLLRTIWAIFVALMFIANVGLVTLLLTHYYQFNTIENIRTIRGHPMEFPDVTLCNVDPVNSYRIYCLKTPEDPNCNISPKHSSILEKYKNANQYFKDSDIWHKFEDPSMVAIFYQLIGMEAATQIGHQQYDFIIPTFCELTTRDTGGILNKRNCRDVGVLFQHLVTYKYFNCYTLSIKDKALSTHAVRLSVILYLDEEEDLTCRPYCTHEFTEWVGGKVVVHSRGSYPDIEKSGMNLLPGASNQILVDELRLIEKKNMASKPCENNENKTFSVVYFDFEKQQFSSREMSYTDSLCIQLLSQNATMEECECIDFLMPVPGSQVHLINQLPFCGNLSHDKVNESLACSQNIRQKYSKQFRNECPIPCFQMQYNYELTQLRWPQKPRILNYSMQLRGHTEYRQKFKIYETIDEIARSNTSMALQMLQKTDVFEKNFLQLDVNRPNFDTYISYRENEEYTLPTLLSQIGGICSIFLSFTCVTVLELIELAFRLLAIACPSLLVLCEHAMRRPQSRSASIGLNKPDGIKIRDRMSIDPFDNSETFGTEPEAFELLDDGRMRHSRQTESANISVRLNDNGDASDIPNSSATTPPSRYPSLPSNRLRNVRKNRRQSDFPQHSPTFNNRTMNPRFRITKSRPSYLTRRSLPIAETSRVREIEPQLPDNLDESQET